MAWSQPLISINDFPRIETLSSHPPKVSKALTAVRCGHNEGLSCGLYRRSLHGNPDATYLPLRVVLSFSLKSHFGSIQSPNLRIFTGRPAWSTIIGVEH